MLARKRVMKEHEGMRLKCNGNIGELLKLPDCLCVSVPDKESLMLYGEDGPVLGFRKWTCELALGADGSVFCVGFRAESLTSGCYAVWRLRPSEGELNEEAFVKVPRRTDEELELFGQLDDRLGPFWFRHIWLCESTLFFFDAGFAMAFNATTLARLPECDMTIDFASPALPFEALDVSQVLSYVGRPGRLHAINRSGQLVELHDDLRDAFHAFDSRVHVDPFDFHVHDDRLYVLDSRYDDEEDTCACALQSLTLDGRPTQPPMILENDTNLALEGDAGGRPTWDGDVTLHASPEGIYIGNKVDNEVRRIIFAGQDNDGAAP